MISSATRERQAAGDGWWRSSAQIISPGSEPSPSAPPTTSDGSASVNGLKIGMTVKDSSGARVGQITQIGKTSDGAGAVAIKVDGKEVVVAASTLTLGEAHTQAVSSQTKAEIKAGPSPNPG